MRELTTKQSYLESLLFPQIGFDLNPMAAAGRMMESNKAVHKGYALHNAVMRWQVDSAWMTDDEALEQIERIGERVREL